MTLQAAVNSEPKMSEPIPIDKEGVNEAAKAKKRKETILNHFGDGANKKRKVVQQKTLFHFNFGNGQPKQAKRSNPVEKFRK